MKRSAIIFAGMAVLLGAATIAPGAGTHSTTEPSWYFQGIVASDAVKMKHVTVVHDPLGLEGVPGAPEFMMWWATSSPDQLYAQVSNNGLNWTAVGQLAVSFPSSIVPVYHPEVIYDRLGFVQKKSPGVVHFKMWFYDAGVEGYNWIRYAESGDGINWQVYEDSPDLASGGKNYLEFSGGSGNEMSVLYKRGGTGIIVDAADQEYVGYQAQNNPVGVSADGAWFYRVDGQGGGPTDVCREMVIADGADVANYRAWDDFPGAGDVTSWDSSSGLSWNSPEAGDAPILGALWTDFYGAMSVVVVGGNYYMYDTMAGDNYSVGLLISGPPSEVWVDDDYCDGCANDGHVWGYDAFDSIQDGIDAVEGSTVRVGEGTYIESLSVSKSVAIIGDASGSQPKIHIPDGVAGGVTITADDVTLENLWIYQDVPAQWRAIIEIPKGGPWPNYTIDYARTTITGCTIEGGYYGAYVHAEDLTVENSTFKNCAKDLLILSAVQGTTNVTNNHFVGGTSSLKKAILVEGGVEQPYVSGTIDISYNTAVGKNNFLVYNQWGDTSQKVDLSVKHNSIDNIAAPVTSFYAAYTDDPDGFQKFNSILIQDNIVTNSGLAAYVDYEDWGGGAPVENRPVPANGQIVVENMLCYNNSAGPTDTTDATGNFGYYDVAGSTPSGASMAMFAMAGNITGDPLYSDPAHAGNDFALLYGSPAVGAASDGTNIGAWQGVPPLTVVWVDDDYCDGCANDGHVWGDDAFDNIQDGIDAVTEGGTVHVGDGTYNLTSPILADKSVILTGDTSTPYNVVVNAPSSGFDRDCFQVVADGVTIEGFKMAGAKDTSGGDGWQNAGVVVGSDGGTLVPGIYVVGVQNTTISNNEITDCSYGIYHFRAQHTTISNNQIHHCTMDLDHWSGKGIQLYGEGTGVQNYDVDILNNEIHDNAFIGIELNHWEAASAIGDWIDIDVLIDGNKIYNNGGPLDSLGYPLDFYRGISANGHETGVTISNNELYGHWASNGARFYHACAGIRANDSKGFDINNNDVHDNLRGIYIYGDDTTFGDENTGFTITYNDIHDNVQGITVDDGDVGSAHYNNIYGNDVTDYVSDGVEPYGVVNLGAGTFDATNNWWGDPSGPHHSPGEGDAVSDNVDYDPWLGQPVGDNVLWLNVQPDSLYVQPGDPVITDMDIHNLLQKVVGCQAMLGYSSAYLQASAGCVVPGGAPWDELIYNSWDIPGADVPGEIDTAIGIDATLEQPSTGTDADNTIAVITLTALNQEGTTEIVFRPDVDDIESTYLADMNAQAIWPEKYDSHVIVIDGTDPLVEVTSPNGGENLKGGGSWVITWTASDDHIDDSSVKLDYYDGGAWVEIASNEYNDGSYTWSPVPLLDINTAKVRVTLWDKAGNSASDTSDAAFIIDSTDPTVDDVAASQDGGPDLTPSGSGNAVQGVVDIAVATSDNLSGVAGAPTVTVEDSDMAAMPVTYIGEGPAGTFNYTVTVTSTTANGAATITVSALADNAGNVAANVTDTFDVNKNQVTGQVELEGLAPPVGGLTRTVVFVATGGTKTTWNVPLDFAQGVDTASFILVDVPDATTHLSAKTAWSLRRKVSAALDGDGQGAADFTGSSKVLGGDLNGSNTTNILDFAILRINWFTHEPAADINGDGDVKFSDFIILRNNWFMRGDSE